MTAEIIAEKLYLQRRMLLRPEQILLPEPIGALGNYAVKVSCSSSRLSSCLAELVQVSVGDSTVSMNVSVVKR